MINCQFEYEKISQNPDLFFFELKECFNSRKQIFQDHMVSHSTFSCRFYRERKWHTLPWKQDNVMFDESNFFLFPSAIYALPTFKICEFNKEYTELTDFEKFFCYVSPYYLRYFLESACIRNDYQRLKWLIESVDKPINEWKNGLKSFLTKYNIEVPRDWLKRHTLNKNNDFSNSIRNVIYSV